MSSDVAVRLEGVGKTYRIFTTRDRTTTFREVLRDRIRQPFHRAPREDFQALTDVNLEVSQGEALGIIGRNGAGKSTLLKILSRIVNPTEGKIEVYGHLGSLLEVGTGFHPELTGRENIYLNGAILGMKRREITRRFDSIVAFSEIERFLDTPVKRYSSGMYVRLAFSVAAHLNPDILLVDEVLAVGDARFQKKCLGKMDEVATEEGRTVMFVSHNMPAIQAICRRTVHLDNGRIVFDGATDEAVDHYLAAGGHGIETETGVFDLAGAPRAAAVRHPLLRRVELRRSNGQMTETLPMGDTVRITIDVDGLSVPRHGVLVRILTDTGVPVTTLSTYQQPLDVSHPELAQEQIVLELERLQLLPGRYSLEITVEEPGARGVRRANLVDQIEHAASFEVIPADVHGTGYVHPSGSFRAGVVFMDSCWEVHSGGILTGATPREQAPSRAS